MTNNMLSIDRIIALYYEIVSRYIHIPINEIKEIYNPYNDISISQLLLKESIESQIKDYGKKIKISFVVEMFRECDGSYSDEEISKLISQANEQDSFIPKISSSSVQRYLTDDAIEKIYSHDIATEISAKRKSNTLKARQKGGENYAKNNTPIRNKNGDFEGSKKEKPKEHADIEKMLQKEANLFLSGISIPEIAKRLTEEFGREITYFDVRNSLMVKLRRYDEELHKKVSKHFIESELKLQEKNKREILEMYRLYIEEGLTFSQIAEKYGINKSNVSRRLESGLKSLLLLFPDEVTPEMVEEVKKRKALSESVHEQEKREDIIRKMQEANLTVPSLQEKIPELTDDIETLFEEESGIGQR